MDSCPGTYALVLTTAGARAIIIGRLGQQRLQAGFYVYVGSAFGPGGVRARVMCHQRRERGLHWHIDYLISSTRLLEIWYTCDSQRREHLWASVVQTMPGASTPIQGFGASDCSCVAHLGYFSARPSRMNFCRRLHAVVRDHAQIRSIVVSA
ncbi:MAG: DUF123 domain-containing protein [Acidiferrobacterales bacterium]